MAHGKVQCKWCHTVISRCRCIESQHHNTTYEVCRSCQRNLDSMSMPTPFVRPEVKPAVEANCSCLSCWKCLDNKEPVIAEIYRLRSALGIAQAQLDLMQGTAADLDIRLMMANSMIERLEAALKSKG